MHHLHIGEDPQWALYRQRERLEFTDSPTATAAPPQSHPTGARLGAVISALAITAVLRADTTAAPTVAGHDGATATPTTSISSHRVDTTGPPPPDRIHRHSASADQTKEPPR